MMAPLFYGKQEIPGRRGSATRPGAVSGRVGSVPAPLHTRLRHRGNI